MLIIVSSICGPMRVFITMRSLLHLLFIKVFLARTLFLHAVLFYGSARISTLAFQNTELGPSRNVCRFQITFGTRKIIYFIQMISALAYSRLIERVLMTYDEQ